MAPNLQFYGNFQGGVSDRSSRALSIAAFVYQLLFISMFKHNRPEEFPQVIRGWPCWTLIISNRSLFVITWRSNVFFVTIAKVGFHLFFFSELVSLWFSITIFSRNIRFEALQSEAGKKLLQRSGRAPDDISSVVLVEKDRYVI